MTAVLIETYQGYVTAFNQGLLRIKKGEREGSPYYIVIEHRDIASNMIHEVTLDVCEKEGEAEWRLENLKDWLHFKPDERLIWYPAWTSTRIEETEISQ